MTATMHPPVVGERLDSGDGLGTSAVAMLIGLRDLPIPGSRKPVCLVYRGAEVYLVDRVEWSDIPEPCRQVEVYSEAMELVAGIEFDFPIPAGESVVIFDKRIV